MLMNCSPVSCSCGCILKKPQGMITSSPQMFPSSGPSKCKWVINLPEGSRVRLWFDALKMNGDSIIIRDGKDVSAPQIVVIKDDKYKEPIISTGNNLYIFYQHNGIWTNGTRRGFTASYRTESKSRFYLPELCRFSVWKERPAKTAKNIVWGRHNIPHCHAHPERLAWYTQKTVMRETGKVYMGAQISARSNYKYSFQVESSEHL